MSQLAKKVFMDTEIANVAAVGPELADGRRPVDGVSSPPPAQTTNNVAGSSHFSVPKVSKPRVFRMDPGVHEILSWSVINYRNRGPKADMWRGFEQFVRRASYSMGSSG